ncbi:MAG: energy-coupled thiamine transporter ThiT [Nitrososphaerales archaeon]|jgi:thiamine transporter
MGGASEKRSGLGIRVLAEAIVMVALSSVLFMVKIFTFPQGGEITLGSMAPIILLSLRRGPKVGVFAGVVFGMIVLDLEPFIWNVPWQVLLDYPLAFGALGLSGLVIYWPGKRGGTSSLKSRSLLVPLLGPVIGIGGRFICHFASGIIFFSSEAPVGESPALYSALYNGAFLLPEFVITEFILFLLLQRNILNVFR